MAVAWQLTSDMFLSAQEVDSLLDHVRDACRTNRRRGNVAAELDRLIIEGLLFSGLRTSEFCHLTVGDTVLGQGSSVFVISGLRGRDRRVHIPRSISCLVEHFCHEVRPGLLPEDVPPNDLSKPFLYGQRRNPMERTGLYRRVVRILTSAGLGDRASVQLLRHTYGYLAYKRSGGNLLFVQRQLGHAHPMVTSIYAQFVEESYEAIAEMVYAQDPSTRR